MTNLKMADVLEDIADRIERDYPNSAEELRALLAAPVVERQEPISDWAIDNSAGRPILTFKKCSVIEAEDAEYILGLVRRDRERQEPVMKLEAERLWEGDGEYSVSFTKSGWLDQCRKTGGTFFLYAEQPAPVAVVLPDDWQDQLFSEMERRFDLRKQIDDDHMVNDDTQVGVEFARDWIAAQLDKAKELNQ